MKLEQLNAEFARRNAAKAARKAAESPVGRQHTHCSQCRRKFREHEPTCFDSRDVPLCYDCSEGGTVS